MIQSGQSLLNTINKTALATVAYGRLLWAQRIGQIAKEEKCIIALHHKESILCKVRVEQQKAAHVGGVYRKAKEMSMVHHKGY
jgi:hypothetical protein